MECTSPVFPIPHYLPESAQTHLHWVIPSSHLIFYRPLLLLPSVFPSVRVFSNESALCSRWLSTGASASVLPMNIKGWFPLGLIWFDFSEVQGTLKSLLQHHSFRDSIYFYTEGIFNISGKPAVSSKCFPGGSPCKPFLPTIFSPFSGQGRLPVE